MKLNTTERAEFKSLRIQVKSHLYQIHICKQIKSMPVCRESGKKKYIQKKKKKKAEKILNPKT